MNYNTVEAVDFIHILNKVGRDIMYLNYLFLNGVFILSANLYNLDLEDNEIRIFVYCPLLGLLFMKS